MPQGKTQDLHKQDVRYGPELIEEAIRGTICQVIEKVLGEEIGAALNAESYQRIQERAGYRNGTRSRILCTSMGPARIQVPRARVFHPDGSSSEFESQVLRRYKRRSKQLDDAILGIYISGTNTRRVKKALRPLLKGVPLSKSAISRLMEQLRNEFERWSSRNLSDLKLTYLYADAIHVRIRMAGRVCKMPVLVTVGVLADGSKQLLSLDLRGSESEQAWTMVLNGMKERGLRRPVLILADGNKGLRAAIDVVWPGVDVQRCILHKLWNLFAHAPKHAHEELHADYRDIVYAKDLEQALQARKCFLDKWSKRCPGVARSIEEAGDDLLTFYRYPESQHKSLRTTNVIERVHEEFRRRIKTQASLPTQDAVLLVMFGLISSGQIRMRKIHGFQDLPRVEVDKKLAPTG